MNQGLESLLIAPTMLTENAIREFSKILSLGESFRVSPILWSSKEKRKRAKVTYFILYYLGISYYICDCAYLFFTLHDLLHSLTVTFNVLLKFILHLASRVIGLIFQYHSISYEREIQFYCSQVFQLHHKLQRKSRYYRVNF